MIRDTSAQDVMLRQQPRRRLLLWVVVLLIVGLGSSLAWSALDRWLGSDLTLSRDRIRTAVVERGDLLRDLNVQGRIVAAVSPTLFSTAAGTVQFRVTSGDTVQHGEVLAVLDSPELESQLAQQSSALAVLRSEAERQKIEGRKRAVLSRQQVDLAQVKLTAAQREMRRAEESFRIQAMSQIDYERHRDDLATAEVEYRHALQDAELEQESQEFETRSSELQVQQQQQLVDNLRRKVDELTVRAPVAGIVGNLLAEQQSVVAENQPLLMVVDLSAFEVEARIPEAYADEMGAGMSAEVQYNGQTYPGELTSLSAEVINSEVAGRIRFTGQTPPGLRQNQRVTARLLMDELHDVLVLQRGPFADTAGGTIAFVVGDDRIARRHDITLGARSAASIEVVSGLQAGDEVVISSISEFSDKELIRLVP